MRSLRHAGRLASAYADAAGRAAGEAYERVGYILRHGWDWSTIQSGRAAAIGSELWYTSPRLQRAVRVAEGVLQQREPGLPWAWVSCWQFAGYGLALLEERSG